MDEKLVKIAVVDDIFERDIMEDILRTNGITAVFRSYEDNVYGDLFQSQKGWGSIFAPAAYKEEILSYLTEIRRQKQEVVVDD